MRIYVDYDDCLCETARSFSKLAVEMFGKNVAYEEIKYFDLYKSFDLNHEQFEDFMMRGHQPEVLLSFFNHLPDLKVMVFDRPWNRACEFPNENYHRYSDWESIKKGISVGI